MAKIDKIMNALLAEEVSQPVVWWYLSFGDKAGWLGGVFVEARGIVSASQEARRRGVNPGGEVVGSPAPAVPPIWTRGKLLTRDDLVQAFGGITRLRTTGTEDDREIHLVEPPEPPKGGVQ